VRRCRLPRPGEGVRYVLLVLVLVGIASPAAADSIFSALGLGEVVTTSDMRGRGMGNTSVGVDDPWNMGRGNPATLANVGAYVIHGELMREGLQIESDTGDRADPNSTNLPQVRLGIKVPKVGVLGLALAEVTSVSYSFQEAGVEDGEAVLRTFEGKNGLDVLTLTYARQFRPRIALGADLDFMLGSFQDIWTTDFVDPQGFDTIDSLVVEHSVGPVLRLGILANVRPHLDLGAALTFGRNLELRPEIKTQSGISQELPRYDLSLPLTIAFGASGDLSSRWRATGDFTYSNWSATDLTLGTNPVLNRSYAPTADVVKLGFGVEYQRDRNPDVRSYWKRVPIRGGFAWEPWNILDTHGEKLTDKIVTGGLGLPLGEGIGVIQLAMQYVWRGDVAKNDAEERVFRLGVGFTAREKVAVEKGRERR
jgi:hypothetical protein